MLVYLALQCALAAIWATSHHREYVLGLVAGVLTVATGAVAVHLSRIEHGRALRPSTTLISYFSLTLFFDFLWLRTIWNQRFGQPYMVVFTGSIAIKAIVAVLESVGKRRYANFKATQFSPEDWAGLWNRIACIWVFPLLIKGYRSKLSIDDTGPLPAELKTKPLAEQFRASMQGWNGKRSLIWKLVWVLRWPLLYPILPHVLSTVFILSKPLLMKEVLQYLGRDESQPASEDTETSLIIATFIIYAGCVASISLYQNMGDRLILKAQAMLVSEIYRKVVLLPSTEGDQVAITLMSTDVTRFCIGLYMIHDFCSKVVQVGVGIWLLQRELGVAAIAPFLTAAGTL